MCGNYYQYHAPCGHGGIVSLNFCRALGSTCSGPDPSKGMDITLPPINSICSDCHAAAHQPNPDARLDENDPYRKEARERAAALDRMAREFRVEQAEKLKREEAKQEEEKRLPAEVKKQEKEAREKRKMKRKIADDADSRKTPAKKVREEKKGSRGKKGDRKEMKGKNHVEAEEDKENRNDNMDVDGNDNGDDGYASDIYNA
ncbi:hypothetical protein QR685DRAFT_606645 [Neurospora intermedia]|uniref:Uncharacterized protein n=1 Tax=Neurospora intermedia TaxID=5142 RepID=A0ABR3DAW9_NEUIN